MEHHEFCMGVAACAARVCAWRQASVFCRNEIAHVFRRVDGFRACSMPDIVPTRKHAGWGFRLLHSPLADCERAAEDALAAPAPLLHPGTRSAALHRSAAVLQRI